MSFLDRAAHQPHITTLQQQMIIGHRDVQVAGPDLQAVPRGFNAQGLAVPAENIGEYARPVTSRVEHCQDGGFHGGEEAGDLDQRLDASGGSSYDDDVPVRTGLCCLSIRH